VVTAAVLARRKPSWQTKALGMLDELDQVTGPLAAMTPDGVRAIAAADATALGATPDGAVPSVAEHATLLHTATASARAVVLTER